MSDSVGEDRIYLQPFPQGGPPIPVSPEAGTEPLWSSDGRELYYRDGTSIRAVPVDPESGEVGVPEVLFADDSYAANPNAVVYDVAEDGRFLMGRMTGGPLLHLVTNWFADLNRLVPVD